MKLPEPLFSIPINTLRAFRLFTADDSRKALNGVCVEVSAESVHFIATNGMRLLAAPVSKCGNTPQTFTIPNCLIDALPKFAGNPLISVAFDGEHLILDGQSIGKPVTERFPKWRTVVPIENSSSMTSGAFNANFFSDFGKAFELLTGNPIVRVFSYGASDCLRVACDSLPDVIALLMPCRGSAINPAPTWHLNPFQP